MAEWIVKTCLSVVFERLTIKVRAHTNQKERGGKRYSMQILSISEKIDFRTKTDKSQRRVLYNDKGINIVRRHIIYKYRCTHYRRAKIEKENINTYEFQGSNICLFIKTRYQNRVTFPNRCPQS